MAKQIDWKVGAHAEVRQVIRDMGKLQLVVIRHCDHVHHSERATSRCANQLMRKWQQEIKFLNP